MITPLIRRFVYALLLLGMISVIAFGLSTKVPGDVVLDYLSIDDPRYSTSADPLEQREAYARVAAKRGLNRPPFYFSIQPGYYPDSLFSIVPADDRAHLYEWVKYSKDGGASMDLYKALRKGLAATCPLAPGSAGADTLCGQIGALFSYRDPVVLFQRVKLLAERDGAGGSPFMEICSSLFTAAEKVAIREKNFPLRSWLPRFRWHGTSCQYHRWITGLISFRPLTSLVDGRNAWTKVSGALKWTLWLNGLAFILAIVLGTLIGIWSGFRQGSKAEKIIQVLLFALFAIPSFWLATLLIAYLSSGGWLGIFPAGGLGPYHTAGNIFEKWAILLRHLALPVFCLAAGSLAYVSRQMKQSVVSQFRQPYVLSFRTQGISEKTILRRHVVPNALFPLITMIGGALPALLSGSLIIEVIFSIPGMGRLMYTSILARDWPVVFPLLMLGAAITVLAYFITDIVYKWADPRVKSIGS